jgi:hypothetical protein
MEHVRVDAADGKPIVINATSALFQKTAGPGIIILRPECVSGDIKCPVLVAEFGGRGWLKSRGINGFYCRYIAVEQEYMPVELSCAALRAGCTAESNLPDNPGKAL